MLRFLYGSDLRVNNHAQLLFDINKNWRIPFINTEYWKAKLTTSKTYGVNLIYYVTKFTSFSYIWIWL